SARSAAPSPAAEAGESPETASRERERTVAFPLPPTSRARGSFSLCGGAAHTRVRRIPYVLYPPWVSLDFSAVRVIQHSSDLNSGYCFFQGGNAVTKRIALIFLTLAVWLATMTAGRADWVNIAGDGSNSTS